MLFLIHMFIFASLILFGKHNPTPSSSINRECFVQLLLFRAFFVSQSRSEGVQWSSVAASQSPAVGHFNATD